MKNRKLPVELSHKLFRPGTYKQKRKILFYFNQGGIGDYINYSAAIMFAAKENPQIIGDLYAPHYMIEIMENLLKPFPDWTVIDRRHEMPPGYLLYQAHQLPANPTTMHLMDLGFIYYATMSPPPHEYNYIPQLDLSDIELKEEVKGKNYVVMTPGVTWPSRHMRHQDFNRIADAVIERGLDLVFLGSDGMKNDKGQQYAAFDSRYKLDKGIDLRNKTTLLEAAQVMKHSQAVIGLDNGLLHLAAMTDAPIVFGYTIVGPRHRRPRRKKGITIDVIVSKDDLSCIHCQESIKFFPKHRFGSCFYNDFKCLSLLNADKYINALDRILKTDPDSGLSEE